jgi:hypothetical protein
MLKTAFFHLLILGLITSSCSKDESDNEIIEVKYGFSFNMCVGYCKNDISLKSGVATYNYSGWSDDIEPATCSRTLENNSWNSFNTDLDIDSFFELPDNIGCPDCADGGAEWVEIELTNGEKHKVIFEYGEEPPVLNSYIIQLRDIMSVGCSTYNS